MLLLRQCLLLGCVSLAACRLHHPARNLEPEAREIVAVVPEDDQAVQSSTLSTSSSVNSTTSTVTTTTSTLSSTSSSGSVQDDEDDQVEILDVPETTTTESAHDTVSSSSSASTTASSTSTITLVGPPVTVVKTLERVTSTPSISSTPSSLVESSESTDTTEETSTDDYRGSITANPTTTSLTYDPYVSTYTLTRNYTFSGLNTVVQVTTTSIDYLSTHQAPNAYKCIYWGDCPSSEEFPTELVSLSKEDASARKSQCDQTINLSEATAELETTVETSTITHLATRDGQVESSEEITEVPVTRTRGAYDRAGCGGLCDIVYYNVEVLYWAPSEWSNGSNCVFDPAFTNTFPDLTVRDVAPQATGSIAVNDEGFTFTSPSVYVRFGTVSATNDYGQVGDTHSSFTLAFAPGELYTGFYPLGQIGNAAPAFTSYPFNPANITCNSRPVIEFPTKIREVDPAWAQCTGGGPYRGNDPPIALTPAGALEDPQTAVDPRTTEGAAGQAPGPTPASSVATMFEPTRMPDLSQPSGGNNDPGQPQVESSPADAPVPIPKPTGSSPRPDDSDDSDPQAGSDPPASAVQPAPQDPQTPTEAEDRPQGDSNNGQGGSDPTANDPPSNSPPANDQQDNSPPANENPDSPPTSNSPAQQQAGIADAIASAIGISHPDSAPQTNRPALPAEVSLLNPNALVVGSATLTPGSSPTTVNGHIINFAGPGAVVVDSSTMDILPGALPTPDSQGNIQLGQGMPEVSVLEPGVVVVGSSTVTQGAGRVTIAGEVVSWGDAGLVVGDKTVDVDGLVTGVANADVVRLGSGETLTRGGATRTVGGVEMYLGTAGLVSGGETLSVPMATGTGVPGGDGEDGIATGAAERRGGRLEVVFGFGAAVVVLALC